MRLLAPILATIALIASSGLAAADLNSLILEQVKAMPAGGDYAVTRVATIRLQSAAHFEAGKFFVLPSAASPSYCSGATYLVFLKTIEALRNRGELKLENDTLMALMIKGQRDGQGIWGRWNANGPGSARLFHELDLGPNFDSYVDARPGDFMKIFWTSEVGKAERGHLVVYLGTEVVKGEEHVRFWSSNIPAGYGEKSVPRKKVANVLFSRLERPENLNRIKTIPDSDKYLASLLTVRSSFPEAKKKSGL